MNGHLEAFPSDSTVTYWYKYSTDPTLNTGAITTANQTLTATGGNDPTNPTPVTGLAPGTYYYQVYAIDPVTGLVKPGGIVPFVISATDFPTRAPTQAPTQAAVLTNPVTNVINGPSGGATLNGQLQAQPGSNVTYYYKWSLDPNLVTGVTTTPADSLIATGGVDPTDPIAVSNLAPGKLMMSWIDRDDSV